MTSKPMIVSIPNVRQLRHGKPTGKALERLFALAARENRKAEMSELSQDPNAISLRSFLAASTRSRKSARDVPLSRSITEVAWRWRELHGQTLPGHLAVHIGKKLLKEQVVSLRISDQADINATRDREEAMTQLLSIVDPQLRVTVHAFLLACLNEHALEERAVVDLRPGEGAMTRSELQKTVEFRARRIESKGFEMVSRCAMHAAAFDGMESDYEQSRSFG